MSQLGVSQLGVSQLGVNQLRWRWVSWDGGWVSWGGGESVGSGRGWISEGGVELVGGGLNLSGAVGGSLSESLEDLRPISFFIWKQCSRSNVLSWEFLWIIWRFLTTFLQERLKIHLYLQYIFFEKLKQNWRWVFQASINKLAAKNASLLQNWFTKKCDQIGVETAYKFSGDITFSWKFLGFILRLLARNLQESSVLAIYIRSCKILASNLWCERFFQEISEGYIGYCHQLISNKVKRYIQRSK